MTSARYVLELDDVGLRYPGRRPVLRGLDLYLAAAETVVVCGVNGSGKSSLLKVAAGALTATTGRVRRRPRSVGYVPDRFPSRLRMPAASYVRHMAALHRADPRATHEVLDTLGFSGGLDVPMAELSKGNTQKVALAQALGSGAELLVLDEPFSGLDARAAGVLHAVVSASDAAVLITDHTRSAIGLPSPRWLTLSRGRLSSLRPPDHGRAVHETSDAADVVVILSAPDPRRTLMRLPGVEALSVDSDRVTVSVPAALRDVVLARALALGCGVEAVTTGGGPR